MKVEFTRNFIRNFKKRIAANPAIVIKFEQRLLLFSLNPKDPILNDHKLTGKKIGLRAFSIAGDIRVIYYIHDNTAYFADIGTHNQVY